MSELQLHPGEGTKPPPRHAGQGSVPWVARLGSCRRATSALRGGGLTRDEQRRDPSHVLALTDGVYAIIIITLLLLDIHVPELSAHETLGRPFRRSGLALSASRSPSSWRRCVGRPPGSVHPDQGYRPGHRLAQSADPVYRVPTAVRLRAAVPLSPGPLALRMFGLILIATSLSRTIIWVYATPRPSVVYDPIGRGSLWSGLALSVFPLVIHVAAFAVAGVSTGASLAVCASAPVLYSSRSRCCAGWLPAARKNASSPSHRPGAGINAGGSGPGP